MSGTTYYIFCTVLILGVLAGISLMSRMKTAAAGNLFSALCMALAILLTLYKNGLLTAYSYWLCLIAGLAAGLVWAGRIKMIEMPRVVALFNGFGGAASALVAVITLLESQSAEPFVSYMAGLALAVGVVTLAGSLAAVGRLHHVWSKKMSVRPVYQWFAALFLAMVVVCVVGIGMGLSPGGIWIWVCTLAGSFLGVAFFIRVGRTDMPVAISLLNSLSGLAGSITGMAVGDPLLVAAGGVVGASGLLLTQIMCRAMNRSLLDIFMGKTQISGTFPAENSRSSTRPVIMDETQNKTGEVPELAQVLKEAKRVIIIPGSGMAMAQVQQPIKQLVNALESGGAQVDFAVHPLAGRMPGHMNMLLAEADISYEKLRAMEDVNPHFTECDLAIVIGANDVINPAAQDAEGTLIYGMPILAADKAKRIIICNYDLSPGFSGVENPLYHRKDIILMLGDAQETVERLIDALTLPI